MRILIKIKLLMKKELIKEENDSNEKDEQIIENNKKQI